MMIKMIDLRQKKNDDLIKLSDKYKYELTHFVENNVSKYPALKGYIDGETRLEDIFNYLNFQK